MVWVPRSAFHLYGKTSCSGGRSNGTVLSKENTLRGIPLFLFLLELPEHHFTVCFRTLVPCSSVRYAFYFPKLPVERTVPFLSPNVATGFFFYIYIDEKCWENSYWFFHTNGKSSRCLKLTLPLFLECSGSMWVERAVYRKTLTRKTRYLSA